MEQQVGKKELRDFGLLVGGVFGVIGLWPLLFRGESVRLWAVTLSAVLILLGGTSPVLLKPVHRLWMWIGHVLGWVNTRILLGIVFYGLITPIAITFRMLGKDAMGKVFAESSPSYRVLRKPRTRGHMKYQF